jgi:hypothetical protein
MSDNKRDESRERERRDHKEIIRDEDIRNVRENRRNLRGNDIEKYED